MQGTGKSVLLSGGADFDCSISSDYRNVQSKCYNIPVPTFICIQDTGRCVLRSETSNWKNQTFELKIISN
jgi:hypothetical protein